MRIENVGPIKQCDIKLSQETIFLGKNNSGKTYISYLLYGMFKRIDWEKREQIKRFLSDKITGESVQTLKICKSELVGYVKGKIFQALNEQLANDLPIIFNDTSNSFRETKITVAREDVDSMLRIRDCKGEFTPFSELQEFHSMKVQCDDEFCQIAFEHSDLLDFEGEGHIKISLAMLTGFFIEEMFKMPTVLYLPAERNGINVFRKELMSYRSSQTFDMAFNEKTIEKYPMAIADYMKYLNKNDMKGRNAVEGDSDSPKKIWSAFTKDILKGTYEYDKETNNYSYRTAGSENKRIPLQISSSSIKSLFGLEAYLKEYEDGDVLFIDEPEMNLDPGNQIELAELLVDLANQGVRVILSSHSDYLVRATTNKMLAMKVQDSEVCCDIQAYYFDGNTVQPIGDLAKADYIDIFDDSNERLETQYFLLKDQLTSEGE